MPMPVLSLRHDASVGNRLQHLYLDWRRLGRARPMSSAASRLGVPWRTSSWVTASMYLSAIGNIR